MSEPILVCHGLVKHFGGITAVEDVDLDVARGELLALLGPSGCGKTTLLRLIAGFEMPDSGTITLAGRTLASAGSWVPPERRRVAMVFQDFALFPHMSVGANVAFGLPSTLSRASRRARTGELLSLVSLDGLDKRMPDQLSGGQQQRVAIARALASEPELILLDEPFSNLDPAIRQRVRFEVKQLLGEVGSTAMFVTHDQEEALSLAEKVAVMVDGRILQVGPPSQVYNRSASRLVGEFLGNANVIPGSVLGGVAECEFGRFPVSVSFEGPAQVMVRSESLALSTEGGLPAVVLGTEYFGHDQMVAVRTASGTTVRIRLLAAEPLRPGTPVGLVVTGEVFAFPAQ